jgi:hypothetical protein
MEPHDYHLTHSVRGIELKMVFVLFEKLFSITILMVVNWWKSKSVPQIVFQNLWN